MKCPNCNSASFEFVAGDFGTGVKHPDGTEETRYEEGFICLGCRGHFELSDLGLSRIGFHERPVLTINQEREAKKMARSYNLNRLRASLLWDEMSKLEIPGDPITWTEEQ
jgi:hypothetical protein